ncbi:alpha/beta hydrolase family protein [Rhodobacterales bacterium HKCCE2091]|nr:alpha/beta hydrolase family protein [Rhodobacterales bacterium HKCCE2091]
MTDLRDTLDELLGRQRAGIAEAVSRPADEVAGAPLADLDFTLDDGTRVPGWFIRPDGARAAVLYCHAHGGNYALGRDELLHGRPALQGAYGPALAAAGFAALAIDLPCFGQRRDPPESARAKEGLWRGTPLFGRMLAELAAAFRWLDAQGIGPVATLGLSMGATHAFWLAALEPGIAAAAHIACFADLEALVETGNHDLHGNYMTVPGLLPAARTGQIAGLVAPRPQLVCAGRLDPLTPPAALDRGLSDLAAAYAGTGTLETLVDPNLGHAESPAMRAAVMDFLQRVLHPAA